MADKRGRPPLDPDDQSVEVCVTLPSRKYDEIYERARRERVSVPEIIRRDLIQPEKK
jgi:hypothetical protein